MCRQSYDFFLNEQKFWDGKSFGCRKRAPAGGARYADYLNLAQMTSRLLGGEAS